MRRPKIIDGWLVVPFSGSESSPVHIGIGVRAPTTLYPAFLDYVEDQRVAKIRPPAGFDARGVVVWVSVDGFVTSAGSVA